MWNLTGAKIDVSSALVVNDLLVFRLFSAVREMVDMLLPEDEADETLYEMLETYVCFMADENQVYETKKYASIRFCTLLLKHLGHLPDSTVCQKRGERIHVNDTLVWNLEKGFVCNKCAKTLPVDSLLALSPSVLYTKDQKQKISDIDVTHWEKVIADIYSRVSERELLSFK